MKHEVTYDHINLQVFRLLEDLEVAGQTSSPRGLKVKEAMLATLEINPVYPIMNFEPRKFDWKYFAGETAWYLKANPNIDFINNFSSFWKNICINGYANSNYGNLLFNIHPSTNMDQIEADGGVKQLEWIFNSLIKDSNTRQAIGFFNAPVFQYDENKDFVCTMYVNFWIRFDKLYMKVQMRSNDIFYGLTYDAPWFSTIHQNMFLSLKEHYPKLQLGTYYHCADNIHFYERHFEIADKILESDISSSIKLTLKKPLYSFYPTKFNIESGEKSEFKVELSDEAKKYIQDIDILIKSKDKNASSYKKVLETLYTISE